MASTMRGILPANASQERLFHSSTVQIHTNSSSDNIHWGNRWHFLKRLPHKLLRDIGMVISCPPLLSHSSELPLVCCDLLGGGSESWAETAKWLDTINLDHVQRWFETKKNNGRLGEHFAFCIEYILLFSPMGHVKNLIISQQVSQREALSFIHEDLQEETRNNSQEACGITIAKADLDVLVKWTGGSSLENFQSSSRKSISETAEFEDIVLGIHQNRAEMGKRTKTIRKINRLKHGKGPVHTIGEFDFLFMDENTASKTGETCVSYEIDEIRIFHWEVSVKFLLYAGPWGMFGLETPNQAVWKSPNEGPVIALEKQFDPSSNIKKAAMDSSEFLGCFLGPHVGETLYDRKMRLKKQISLVNNVHAATLLWKLFVPSLTEIQPCTDHGQTDAINDSKHISTLRVSPRVLLKGYLFYEYKLWRHLQRKDFDQPSKSHSEESLSTESNEVQFHADHVNPKLNVDHWMGWWTRLNEFLDFAGSTEHNHSKWYIVPKLEWLSPVVIGLDEVRSSQLLDANELLLVAAKVQDEAERSSTPRKRRFMLAEMIEDNGFWTERSRGFIVEGTWPDSRLYKPHGYNLSWYPTHHIGYSKF